MLLKYFLLYIMLLLLLLILSKCSSGYQASKVNPDSLKPGTYSDIQASNWNIITISGDTIANCSLQKLYDSLLTFEHNGIIKSIPIDSINNLFIHEESHFGTGAAIGSVTGIALGAALGAVSSHHPHSFGPEYSQSTIIGGGVLGGLAGFAVGETIGASSGGDKVYDISKKSHPQKVMLIRMLMSK